MTKAGGLKTGEGEMKTMSKQKSNGELQYSI